MAYPVTSAEAVYLQVVKWVLPLLLLAGCWNDEPGLHLQVSTGGTGAVRVELYLATRACGTCANTMKPAGVGQVLDGDVWFLDGDKVARTPSTVVAVSGNKVVFDLLPPGSTAVDVKYIVALGYSASDEVVGVARLSDVTIPAGTAKFWKVELDAATQQASSDDPTVQGDRVWVWRRPADSVGELASCVGLEVADKSTISRLWLVPEDDTDCDGVAAGECDAYNFMAMGHATVSDASCVKPNTDDPKIGMQTCLVGGPACIDGSGETPCGPVLPYYCAPTGACDMVCRGDLPACIADGGISYVKITMPTGQTGEKCQMDPAQSAVVVDLGALLPSATTFQARCKSIRFANTEIGSLEVTSDFRPPGAVFTASSVAQGATCKFTLSWAQGAPDNDNNYGFFDLELDNGTHELVPLYVQMVGGNCTIADTADFLLRPSSPETITNCALVKK